MEREILFRGKSVYKEYGWVYGDLSLHVQDGIPHIFPKDGYDSPDFYRVIPETVGQYTGLHDNNGKQIFDGDIVSVKQGRISDKATISFEHGAFVVTPVYANVYDATLWDYWYNDWDIEVIGNIFDNPELLE